MDLLATSSTWRGALAELRWSYRRGATLGAWTLTIGRDADAGGIVVRELTAAIAGDVDVFVLRQRPLTFCVARPTGAWRWPIDTITIGEKTIRARLGAREVLTDVAIRATGE